MDKNKQYEQLASQILASIGGKDNISYVTHCMTRLRFNIKDNSLVQEKTLTSIPGVLGVARSGGQLQIIIGQTVEQVYTSLCQIGGFEYSTPIQENLDTPKEKLTLKKVGNKILDALAGCLTPLIPLLVAASMFKMLVAVLGPGMLNLIAEGSDLFTLLTFVGDAGFYFFPIFIAYTASKKFHVTTVVAMFLGGIMIHPTFVQLVTDGKNFSVYGIPAQPQLYASTVIPIIFSVWIMSYVEKFFKKHLPTTLKTIFAPTLTIAVMIPLTLIIIGPAGNFAGNYLTEGILAFGNLGGIAHLLAIGLVGALWQFLVMTGMHLLMITTMIMLFSANGSDNFVTLGAVAASMAVTGMCLGAALRIKNSEERNLAWSYVIAGIIGGVTEPGMYGVAVKYRRPFVGLMAGGFAGAVYASITGVTAYALVPVANFLALSAYAGGSTINLINGVISGLIAILVSAIVTYLIGVEQKGQVK
ncbi:PTS transporter subunit EIIC [Enterococcus rivorum]|uniref:PTS fructose transporter subunit IIB n=1 Tax=Enterococcus rivorum TaxID=762845 RepID=A0A1E5KSN0_9ENTE|nr:PTS transporter subunit EIIC [Enterococcus rivorum]MBP2098208.1 PTS system beta-glucosides-specific IIC component [Enterococcus rivorum]OEH80871.1 PTS fructose transporter subunit IIB [Enterococcus rivorum]